MADIKISDLTAATTPLGGTEVLPIVQSGVTVKVAVSNLTAGRSVSATAVAITGSTSGTATIVTPAVAGTPTITLPIVTGTLATLAGTETLTNKTLTGAVMNGTVGATTPSTGAFTSLSSTIGANFATSSGNVGIATTSPGAALTVFGNNGSFGMSAFFSLSGSVAGIAMAHTGTVGYIQGATTATSGVTANIGLQVSGGNVGIGTAAPAYKLEISTDSAGKPGVGGLWTVVSDERIKSDIVPANLDRCYEIVKSVPLKYFGFAPGVYTDDQIQDKHNLGWIAQDVQKVFKNAVSIKPFTLKTNIPDGEEEYEEQDFTLETVEKTETSIQVINGKAVQVSKVVTSENKVLLFDTVDVVDEAGAAVLVDDKPLTYQMPRMITKTRPKVRHDVIEDCLDLNGAQMLAALYGAVQSLMKKIEKLENR